MSRGKKQTSKADILAATRKLIEESGYNKISMRDVAAELGISVGNLTYYYKSKLELIEAAITDKQEHTEPLWPAETLAAVDELLIRTQQLQQRHVCYYRQYSQLAALSPVILERQAEVYRKNEYTWTHTLINLEQQKLLKPEWYEGQYRAFISALLFLLSRWYEREALDQALQIEPPGFRDTVWALITPLLSEEGKEQYRLMKQTERGL